MELLARIVEAGESTLFNIAPIIAVLLGFQLFILRRRLPNIRRMLAGCVAVAVGLTLFLVGLNEALFPIGQTMVEQLTQPVLDAAPGGAGVQWFDYAPVYAFGACIGMAAALAEPALIAVSLKAEEVSGRTVPAFGLRLAVALGAGAGVALGTLRIVLDTSLPVMIGAAYAIVALQTLAAPRSLVAIAYDVGGVTTSTVTVPVVAALGLGLASAIPGRSPLLDGFGLIAFTCLCPIMTVLAYATAADRMRRRRRETD
ncbi:MAG: DUF1538 domain-containing protein [Rhodospirillales bacterium]|nr:DUF1538 domain-containing protein [Rhodospirillales bacterium]